MNPNPTIFNGKKIMVKVVIDMIKKINPSILTVTGHPRTPRDQGSIERANKTVKRILSDVCAERRKEGLDDNWTNLLGRLTSNLNSFHGRQTNSVLAYKAIFGIDYHLQTTCSVEDAHLCNTIDELKEVIDDNGHLEHFLSDLHGYNEDDHQLGELPSVNDTGLIRRDFCIGTVSPCLTTMKTSTLFVIMMTYLIWVMRKESIWENCQRIQRQMKT